MGQSLLVITIITSAMSIDVEAVRLLELFQLPFMQRALLASVLTGLLGGLLDSFAILRQLSFFSDALGHSALLGITLGILLNINPVLVLLPFAALFGLGVTYLLERTRLSTDALLNVIYSASLALAVIALTFVKSYRGNLTQFLFGDILAVRETDLLLNSLLLLVCAVFLGLTLRAQMLLTLHEPLAKSQGIAVQTQRTWFVVVLSLVVGVSVKTIGVLLVSAFIVIPACTARLLSQRFTSYMLLSTGLGALSAVTGMGLSAALNLPSGPCIIVTQSALFLLIIALSYVGLIPSPERV